VPCSPTMGHLKTAFFMELCLNQVVEYCLIVTEDKIDTHTVL
jgi:hypothetical protein